MSRRAVQIETLVVPSGPANSERASVFALADDGTVWGCDLAAGEPRWRPLPPLPDYDVPPPDEPPPAPPRSERQRSAFAEYLLRGGR